MYIPWGCAFHHLACTVQSRECTRMGANVYICSCGLVEYCAIQTATQTPPGH